MPDNAPPTEPVVLIEDLHLTLDSVAGPVNILRGLDLAVGRGETVSIVGPSGSGKTSLMMVIAGIERQTAGRVVVAGAELSELDEDGLALLRRTSVGIVFQSFHLVPTMTALENVAIPLELAGRDDAFDRAQEALASVSLDHRLTHYPGQLSGGEQQRVAVARAFVAGPELLLADEPTGNLDGATGEAVMELLFDLSARHDTTLILITHDMGVIAETADRVAVMYAGRLVEIGEARKVIQNAKHPYTLGLMGSIPTIGDTEEELRQIHGSMPRLAEIPEGCAFNPRCPNVSDRCRKNRPELQPVDESSVACWLFEDSAVPSELS